MVSQAAAAHSCARGRGEPRRLVATADSHRLTVEGACRDADQPGRHPPRRACVARRRRGGGASIPSRWPRATRRAKGPNRGTCPSYRPTTGSPRSTRFGPPRSPAWRSSSSRVTSTRESSPLLPGVRSTSAGQLAAVEQAAPTPASGEQPDRRPGVRPRLRQELPLPPLARLQRCRPPVEPEPARARIECAPWRGRAGSVAALGGVVAVVEQHVTKREPDLGRRPERARVVPLAKQPTPAAERAVEPAGQPNLEADHPAGQASRTASLDDEVQVIRLHAELDHAEVRPMPTGEDRRAHDPHRPMTAQRPHPVDHPQCDVLRKARREALASPVRDPGPPRRPPRTGPPPAPPGRPPSLIERELSRAPRPPPPSRPGRRAFR